MFKLPRTYWLPLFVLVLEIFGFVYLFRLDSQKNNDDFYNYYKKLPVIAEVIDKKNEYIDSAIQNYVGKVLGDYAVYVKDLKSGKEYKFNEERIFGSASIYKLAILYKVYEEIGAGRLSGSDIVTAKQLDLDRKLALGGEGVGEIDAGGGNGGGAEISYPVDYAVRLMIRVSDNYSALMLANKVGWKNTQKSLENFGILGFDLTSEEAPTVTALAAGGLLEAIYKQKAVGPSASVEMNEILLEQKVNDRIPRMLPNDIKVAHKTGDLGGLRHDAGIVYGQKSDYLFVFLTNTKKPLDVIENVAVVSREIFDILEN